MITKAEYNKLLEYKTEYLKEKVPSFFLVKVNPVATFMCYARIVDKIVFIIENVNWNHLAPLVVELLVNKYPDHTIHYG
jgi:hypothetical protein